MLALLASVLTTVVTISPAQALATCAIGSAAQSNLTVEPSQPTVMYIDSGVTPRIDAAYVGYRIKNTTGATISGYWTSVTNFVGGVVSLANPLDKYVELPDLANNASTTVYFLVKATGATKTAQTHDFKIFNKRPDASTATNPYGCTFGFAKVAETIKASANKLDNGFPSVSAIGNIGETFTVTAQGATGTIGAGSADVGRILWFTPTAYSDFPTRAFRLESVAIKTSDNSTFSTGQNKAVWTYSNRLFVNTSILPDTGVVTSSEVGADPLSSKRFYRNVYTFRVIGKASGVVAPISQISSGTQIKHQATVATAAVNSSTTTSPITIAKTIDTTTANVGNLPKVTISGSTYVEVPYKVTLTNSASTTSRVDQVVDVPAQGGIYKAGSSQIKVGSASVISLANPETLTSESNLNPRPLHFIGPFDVPGLSTVIIYYKIYIPCVQGTYSNSASAYIGDYQIIASGVVGVPAVNITINETGTPTTYTNTTVTLLPDAVTTPVSSIDTSTATINGTIDINNDTRTSGSFEWGTSSTLATSAKIDLGTISATLYSDPLSKSSVLTGLTANTTYYYRIVGVVGTTRYEGQILSFTTLIQKSAPTVTTDPPSGVESTTATLNSTVSANLNSVYVQFLVWKTNDTVTVTVVDDPTTPYSNSGASPNPYTLLSGGFPAGISISMRDGAYPAVTALIAANATVYYIARIISDPANAAGTVLFTGVTRSFSMRTYTDQTITFNPISNITWGDASPTISPTASSGLTVTRSSNTPLVCTINGSGNIVIVGAGTCSISANQSGGINGGNYYNPAAEVSQSFEVLPKAITVNAVSATKLFGNSNPTLTYSFVGSLVNSDTFTGTISRVEGEAVGSYLINQGSLSLNSNYTLTYNSANFTITKRPITITADAISKVYGAVDPALTYTVTSGSLVSGDLFSGSLTRGSGNSVGTYAIETGTVTLNSNYELTVIGANFTITKKTLTLKADNKTKRSNTSDPVFTYSVTAGGLVGSDTLTGTLARFDSLNETPGTYSIETGTVGVNGAAASNYNFSVIAGSLTITDKVIPTLYWPSPSSIVYGTLLSNTQLNAEARETTTALSANCVYSPALGTLLSVGTHTLSVTCTPTDTTTYSSVSGTVSITVTGRPITVTADPQTKEYGATDPTLTYQVTFGSLLLGDSLSGALTRITGETVGLRSINQGTLTNSNYLITYSGASLTITAKSLTVIITAPDKQYDRDVDSLLNIGSLNGVIASDSGYVSVDSSKIVGTFANYNAATNKTVTLVISSGILTGSKSANYILVTPNNPTAAITKAPATVTANNVTVTAGSAIGIIGYTVTDFVPGDSGDPFTGITCLSDYDLNNDDSSTVRYTRCSGGTATNYTPTFVDGSVTIIDAGAVTYSVTYTAGTGGGTPPSESNKPAGGVFNAASASTLSKSGYSFNGWSCNGASTQAAGTPITMPSTNLTCIAQWIQNAQSSGGNTSQPTSSPAAKKKLIANLVTIASTPVKARAVPVATPTPSAKPSAPSSQTPSPTASPSPQPSNSSTPTPSSSPSQSAKPSTSPTPTPSPTTSTPALSQTTVIPTSGVKSISFSGVGVSKVAVVGNEVSVQARTGFSGATTVVITLQSDEEISKITAEVLVLPLAPGNPTATITESSGTRIRWDRSPNAIKYEVTQGGEVLCNTSSVTCSVSKDLASTSTIFVRSIGKSQTTSESVAAKYVAKPVTQVIPEIALVINFDTNKFNLDSGDRAQIQDFATKVLMFGYKEVDISGHTDSQGGVDNNLLSLNRAKSSREFLLSLIPALKVTINGFADAVNVASNLTAEGMARNRRAEFRVVR